MRFLAALWIGKAARAAMRILGRNATLLPGTIALKICPYFLEKIEKPKTTISITGTNGKTTTSNLVCDILELSGRRVLSNRLGSNIAAGIATSLITGSGLLGRTGYETAVFETDERSVKRIYPFILPTHILVINLFRDSIMRNGHPEFIADILTEGIPDRSVLVLNADDPITSRISPENRRVYFGIDRMPTDVDKCINRINDMRICPVCSGILKYEYIRYHHIGRFYCGDCDFKAPDYDYRACGVDPGAMTMKVGDKAGHGEYRLLSNSVFNIYNMVAAIALLREVGLSHEEIAEGISKTKIISSRYREDTEGDIRVTLLLAKDRNALAISRSFEHIASLPGEKQLFLMMNCLYDEKSWSENVCWMYDCDFEFLDKPDITRIVVCGPRAKDLYLRLLIAGIAGDRLRCVRDELEAAEALSYEDKSDIYIFHGLDTYKLSLKVRDKIAGYARSVKNAPVRRLRGGGGEAGK